MVTTSTYKVFFGTTQLHEVFTTFLPHQYLDLGLWSCDCTTFDSTPKVTYFSHLLWKLFSPFCTSAVHKDIRNLGSHSSNGGSWPCRPLFLPSRDATCRWRIFCVFWNEESVLCTVTGSFIVRQPTILRISWCVEKLWTGIPDVPLFWGRVTVPKNALGTPTSNLTIDVGKEIPKSIYSWKRLLWWTLNSVW